MQELITHMMALLDGLEKNVAKLRLSSIHILNTASGEAGAAASISLDCAPAEACGMVTDLAVLAREQILVSAYIDRSVRIWEYSLLGESTRPEQFRLLDNDRVATCIAPVSATKLLLSSSAIPASGEINVAHTEIAQWVKTHEGWRKRGGYNVRTKRILALASLSDSEFAASTGDAEIVLGKFTQKASGQSPSSPTEGMLDTVTSSIRVGTPLEQHRVVISLCKLSDTRIAGLQANGNVTCLEKTERGWESAPLVYDNSSNGQRALAVAAIGDGQVAVATETRKDNLSVVQVMGWSGSWKVLSEFKVEGHISSIAFDGQDDVAVGCSDGNLQLWRKQNDGKFSEVKKMRVHRFLGVRKVVFGNRGVVASIAGGNEVPNSPNFFAVSTVSKMETHVSRVTAPLFGDPLDASTRQAHRDVMVWSGISILVAFVGKLPKLVPALIELEMSQWLIVGALIVLNFYHGASFFFMARRSRDGFRRRLDSVRTHVEDYKERVDVLLAGMPTLWIAYKWWANDKFAMAIEGKERKGPRYEDELVSHQETFDLMSKSLASAVVELDRSEQFASRIDIRVPLIVAIVAIVLMISIQLSGLVVREFYDPVSLTQTMEEARASMAQAKQEQAKQEQAKQEQAKQEQAKQEQAKQEQAKQEQAKQEQAKQEQAKQEEVRRECDANLEDPYCVCRRIGGKDSVFCAESAFQCARFARWNRKVVTGDCLQVRGMLTQLVPHSVQWRRLPNLSCPPVLAEGICLRKSESKEPTVTFLINEILLEEIDR